MRVWCVKEKFDTAHEATKMMLRIKNPKKGRKAKKSHKKTAKAYKCEHCGFYHWGHRAQLT